MICFGSAVSEFPEPLCCHHHAWKKRQHPQSLGIGVCLTRCLCYSQWRWPLRWLGAVLIMPLFSLYRTPCWYLLPSRHGDICCSNVGFENELPPHRDLCKITPIAESISDPSGAFIYRWGWSIGHCRHFGTAFHFCFNSAVPDYETWKLIIEGMRGG